MLAHVWLCTYRDMHLRINAGAGKVKCGWPDKERVDELLADCGRPPVQPRLLAPPRIVALAAVRPGTEAADEITDWQESAFIQRGFP